MTKMKTMPAPRKRPLGAAMLAGGGSAMAQQAGDWVVGAGWLHLSRRRIRASR
jgi:outer membrane protein